MVTDARDLDLQVPGGRLRARRFGDGGDPLVIGIPGLTANLVSLERMAEVQPMVGLDLRGRGMSDVTERGTYGWDNHGRDVVAAATELGAGRFRIVGWSMGAFVGMAAARQAGERIEKMVLIDALGPVSEQVVNLIRMSVNRLGTVYPSIDAYLTLVKSTGLIDPWDESWERYFRYELQEVEGGVTSRTSRDAIEEDIEFGERAQDPEPYWAALTMPTLVIRALRPLVPGTDADLISARLLERFREVVPAAEVAEVDANHYGVGTHPDTARLVRDFLAR